MSNKSFSKEEAASFKDKLQYLKSAVDPRYLLESLGFEITNTTSSELRSMCRIHGGDNRTAFRFNKKRHTWVCFTHRCQESYSNDIIGLIMAVNNVDFMGAVNHLESLVGCVGDFEAQYLDFKRKRSMEDFIDDVDSDLKQVPAIVCEKCVSQFKSFRSTLFTEDGFAKETLDHFDIGGGYTDKNGYVRDVIPIRDDEGALVAYSLRDVRGDAADDDKYKLTFGFDKDKVLYNLDVVKELANTMPIIVVEGFKSVWRLHEYGIKNVVAVMGSGITDGQINLLCTYALSGTILLFDNDLAGIEGTVRAQEMLKGKIDPVYPIFITDTDESGKGCDPADLSKEQVVNYLRGLM